MKVQKIIHEYNAQASHRIIVVDEEGTMHPGPWTAYDSIAHFGSYYAATEYWQGTLPVGIFTVHARAHQTVAVAS